MHKKIDTISTFIAHESIHQPMVDTCTQKLTQCLRKEIELILVNPEWIRLAHIDTQMRDDVTEKLVRFLREDKHHTAVVSLGVLDWIIQEDVRLVRKVFSLGEKPKALDLLGQIVGGHSERFN